ncbi:hypothetical protein E4U44_000481 [Claviceps purpurea]|nr:hypothetical protein E4U44_000481 [Claviceps purpurea]
MMQYMQQVTTNKNTTFNDSIFYGLATEHSVSADSRTRSSVQMSTLQLDEEVNLIMSPPIFHPRPVNSVPEETSMIPSAQGDDNTSQQSRLLNSHSYSARDIATSGVETRPIQVPTDIRFQQTPGSNRHQVPTDTRFQQSPGSNSHQVPTVIRFQQSSGSNSHQVPTVIRFQQSPGSITPVTASLMDTDDPHMSTIITTQQGAIQPFIMHQGPKVLTEQPDTTSIIILFDRAPGQGPKALTEHPARTSQFHESTEE